jgi:Fe-S-cluster containining protein
MSKKQDGKVHLVVWQPEVPARWNSEDPGANCSTCGACCGPFEGSEPVRVWATLVFEDLAKLDPFLFGQLTGDDGNIGYRTANSLHSGLVCEHLEGVVGQRVKCGIYEKRPKCCRDFQPGSPRCRMARAVRGLPNGPRTFEVPEAPEQPTGDGE